jgi:hypothetical protein
VTFLVTRESCRKAKISFSDEKLVELIPEEGLTPQQVAQLASIPAKDRHWILVYASGATDRILREHACWCARQAFARVDNPDSRSIQAIEVSERFARGEATLEELKIAQKAAAEAAYYAAYVDGVNTAWHAAMAAYNITWAADTAAAEAAVFTAYDTSWETLVKDLVSRLTEKDFLEKTKIETKQVVSRWKNLGV